jgi:pyruvate dehydrogenase E1 component alpha subunit
MGTAVDRASAEPVMVKRAKGYNIPAKQIDGMNILEVYEATKQALAACRQGKGPQFLEMVTYRYEGHSIGDRTRYRPEGELDKWRDEKDPIAALQNLLLEEYNLDQSELKAIQDEVDKEMEEAVQFANESPFPALDTLTEHIYPEA